MEKSAKFIIDVSAETKRIFNSSVRFFSKDHRTAKFLIQAEKDKVSIPKDSISRVEILFESVDISYTPTGKVIFNDDMTIEENGLFSYVLPDELLNYSGLMAFEVYIYYVNEDAADSSNRIIYEQRVSAIDRNAGQVELVYIKDMEIAKQAVADKADEVMADMSGYESSLADYEHQIKDGMDQLYDGVVRVSTDEITEIRAELPKVETAANDEITKIQAVLPDVQATAAEETAKIKAQLPIVEAVAVAETENIQAELPKVQSVATEEIGKIKSELPHVQAVAIDEIGKIHSVLPTVEQTAQEVSDHADQKITEYDQKFQQTEQDIATLDQNFLALQSTMKLSEAWAWSKDGTDRFTTIYPGENLWLGEREYYWESATAGWSEYVGIRPTDNGTKFTDATFVTASFWIKTTEKLSTEVRAQVIFSKNGVRQYVYNIYVPRADAISGEMVKRTIDITEYSTEINEVSINVLKPIKIVGEEFRISDIKIELGENLDPIYTPAPSEDPINAYPQYRGLALLPSDLPEDYVWEESAERIKQLAQQETDKLKGEVADIQNWIAQQGGTA